MTQAARAFEDDIHGQLTIQTPKQKCRHLKKFNFKLDFAESVYLSDTHPLPPPQTLYVPYMYLFTQGRGGERTREKVRGQRGKMFKS
jgi:hypothetical protein